VTVTPDKENQQKMKQAVQIRRFTAQYRLRALQAAEKRRLDSLLRRVTGEMLALALERAGVRSRELICIRTLPVSPMSLRLSRGDSALAAEWATSIAQAIARAAEESSTVVRYLSRPLALIDMGTHIAQGRLDRVWAWRQIGFWRGHDSPADVPTAAHEFVAALCREPQGAVAVLAAVAERGLLRTLAPHLEKFWRQLAVTVLDAVGVDLTSTDWNPVPLGNLNLAARQPDPAQLPAGGPEGEAELFPGDRFRASALQRAGIALSRSAILRDLRNVPLPEHAARSSAILALLECEPALARAAARDLFAAADAVCFIAFRRAASTLKSLNDVSQGALPGMHRSGAKARLLPQKSSEPALAHLLPEEEQQPGKDSLPIESQGPLRSQALTTFGGLLYLLHIVGVLKIPERAMAWEAVATRGPAWFQHRLAMALQPMAPDDPAALAFCGLGPAAEHPSLRQPPPSLEEQEFIDALAAEVQGALSEFFPEPMATPEKLVQFVCRRQAQVLADPGWLEIRFSLQDVSVEIRRSGLDIDPGHLPWLGVVVKFVYD
jgi:hypothetical protein